MRSRLLVVFIVHALVVALISCRSSTSSVWPHEQDAMQVLNAAERGDIVELHSLAGTHLITDVSRQSLTLYEFLTENDSEEPLDKIVAAMSFEPGLRLSPLGNGTVQRLWVYPGFAITSPTCWSENDKQSALDQSLFSREDLREFENNDAYSGFSLGFDDNGSWVFFLKARVSRTPANAGVAEELRCK